MNPLASSKCAKGLFAALAAISGLFLLGGCGSSSIATPNQAGFSVSNVNGTYVFATEGADSGGGFLGLTGAFTADGQGNVKAGTMDVIDSGFAPASPVAQSISAGSYTVGADGRGQVKLTTQVSSSLTTTTFTLNFVLTTVSNGVSSHGLISEFDSNGTGSGTLDLQTAVTGLSQLAGPYAFNFSGIDDASDSFAASGAFTLDTNGNIVAGSGIEDFNAGTIGTFPDETLTSSTPATLGAGTAPGSIAFATPGFTFPAGSLVFDFYPIDATHLKFIETDFSEILMGDAFTQTGAAIPNGAMVFTMAGGTFSSGPIATGGLMTGDGSGNFPSGLEDFNDVNGPSAAQLSFSGLAAGAAGTGGRVVVNLSAFFPASNWAIYPSSAGLLMLELDASNVMQGVGYAQTATAFNTGTSVGYGLNLSGFNIASGDFYVDDIAQFDATTGTSNNMTGVLQENDEGTVQPAGNFTGTYTPDTPATGRGGIVMPSLKTAFGGLGLEYYVIDDGTALFIEGDNGQVSSGTFELQSSLGSGVMGAAHRSMSMVHPMVRAKATKLRGAARK